MSTSARSDSCQVNLAAIPESKIYALLLHSQGIPLFFGGMWVSIVLLECDIPYSICVEGINEWEEYISEDVDIDLWIFCSIDIGDRTTLKVSPNHLWYITHLLFCSQCSICTLFIFISSSENSYFLTLITFLHWILNWLHHLLPILYGPMSTCIRPFKMLHHMLLCS